MEDAFIGYGNSIHVEGSRGNAEMGERKPLNKNNGFGNMWDMRESIRQDIELIVHRESQHLASSITQELEKLRDVLYSIAKHPMLQTAVFELDHLGIAPRSSKDARTKFHSKPPSKIHAEPPNAPPENHRPLEIAHLVSPREVFRDIELEVENAFQAAEDGESDGVRLFLDARGDPNAKVAAFRGRKKIFTDCSLLPIAAVGNNVDVVRLLLGARAKVDGTYSFAAGSLQMQWTGTAQDAAVNRGNMEILKEIVKRRADVHKLSSNQANLVWQTSYVGHRQILDYLLQHEVSHKIPAQSQDVAGISFTPLHIATVQGHTPIVEVLLDAKADLQRTNEKEHSPLVDAILCGRTQQIRLLILHGASLLDKLKAPSIICAEGSMKKKSFSPRQLERPRQVFDCLFAERNPVLVHAAALGLHDQEYQVNRFSTEHVLQFMEEGDSDAVIAILKALFRRREVIYRGEHYERIPLRTAKMPQAVHLKHIHVVESTYTFHDIAEMFHERKRPDQSVHEFFQIMFPNKGSAVDFRTYHTTTVTVFESLVQDFHNDIRVVYAIARLSSFDPILETKQCSAIIGANWKSHKPDFCGLVFIQILWVVELFIISVSLLETCPSNAACHYEKDKHYILRVISGIPIPLVLFETVMELAAFSVFVSYSWLSDYFRNPSTYANLTLIVSHFWVLVNILFWGDQDNYYNRIVFAGCCLLNWVYLLYTLTPLRIVGIQTIPILYAVCEITPFMGVMSFFLAGMWNGYLALHFGDVHVFDAFTQIVDFALVAKVPEYLEPPYTPIASGWINSRITHVLVLLNSFLLPIILMNTLIAAVCNSYTSGIENIEKLYQHRRAQVVFALKARSRLFRSLGRSFCKCKNQGGADYESPRTLWYSVSAKLLDNGLRESPPRG